MSQHDFDIANQGFAAFRSDLNNALKALGSLSSGTAEPATTYANQLWYKTDTNTLKIRNEANSAWLNVMVIDQTTGSPSFAAGNVGIGTTSPDSIVDIELSNSSVYSPTADVDNATTLRVANTSATEGSYGGIKLLSKNAADTPGWWSIASVSTSSNYDNHLVFNTRTGASTYAERMRIDDSGNLLVGKTTSGTSVGAGVEASANGSLFATRDLPTANSDAVAFLNRETSFGDIIRFRKDGTTIGVIGSASASTVYVGSGDTTLTFSPAGDAIVPSGTDGATRSGVIDLGNSANRWDTIFATVGTINTSDRTEKQDIEELNDAERRVAVACKGLLRKYRLKSAVALKGEDARIHFGIIAQDLQAAFEAEGLDAGRYGMFINSTWTDEETGEEKSLMGVRYSELLAFMISVL